MAKRKKSKPRARTVATPPAFEVGQRVQVLTGDYGNARGVVESIAGEVHVKLDAHAHLEEATAFDADNLRAL